MYLLEPSFHTRTPNNSTFMKNISWCPCLKVRVNFLPQRNYAAHFTVYFVKVPCEETPGVLQSAPVRRSSGLRAEELRTPRTTPLLCLAITLHHSAAVYTLWCRESSVFQHITSHQCSKAQLTLLHRHHWKTTSDIWVIQCNVFIALTGLDSKLQYPCHHPCSRVKA